MLKLLSADLSRLFRLRSLYIFLLLTLVLDVWDCFDCAADTIGFDIFNEINFLCVGLIIEGAVVTGFFIGSDYTQGTVRNKIAAGASRTGIFFSNWLTSFICMLILTAESYAVTLICGLMLGGAYTPDGRTTAVFLLLSLLFVLVCSAFYTSMYMNAFQFGTTRMGAIILKAILVVKGLFIVVLIGISVMTALDLMQPEYFDKETAYSMRELGIDVRQDPEDPSKYINADYQEGGSSAERVIDILSPVSHMLYIHDERLAENISAVSIEIIIFSAVGYLSFRKRDIR